MFIALVTIGLMSGTAFLPAVMAYGVCTEKLATSNGEGSPSPMKKWIKVRVLHTPTL